MGKHKYKCETLIKCREGHVACKADMIAPGLYIFPELQPSDEVRLKQTTKALADAVRAYAGTMHEQCRNVLLHGYPIDEAKIARKFRAVFKAVGLKPPKPL